MTKNYTMKNIFYFIVLVMLMGSCKVTEITQIPKKEFFSVLDFRKYAEKGFLITTEKYNGEYESIGIISYVMMPEAVRQRYITNSKSEKPIRPTPIIINWKIEDVYIQDAIEGIYNQCLKMGADALVNFNAESKSEEYLYTNPPVSSAIR